MSKEKYFKDLKKSCSDVGVDVSRFVWRSYLVTKLGETYKPTVDQLDDLYAGLVSGVLCNLGSGKTPEYMEGIGPSPEERHSIERYRMFREEIIYGLGGLAHPYEEWIKENEENEDWVDLVLNANKSDVEFEEDPEKWCIELRNKCIPKPNSFK
jgi:hypothetical protein